MGGGGDSEGNGYSKSEASLFCTLFLLTDGLLTTPQSNAISYKGGAKCNQHVQSQIKGRAGIERVVLKVCYTISSINNYKL